MAKLPLSVLPIPGETAMSLALRLASANHVPFREFLRDMGIRPNDLIAGADATLGRVAELSDVSAAELRCGTPGIREDQAWFAGIRFPATSVGRKKVRGCPDCIESQPGLRGVGHCRS